MKNGEKIGTNCKKIVFVGDSAGGNLNTGCVVKIIENGITKPFGLFNIFTPFFLEFTTSPARYLSFVDPLLSYGFAMRVFKYYGSKEALTELKKTSHAVEDHQKQSFGFIKLFSDILNDFYNLNNAKIPKAPDDEFVFSVASNPHLSPYQADDDILRQFPPTKILTVITDPCLDDGVEFSKKLRNLNVKVSLDILNGVNHGFLNFTGVSNECHLASMICLDRIVEIVNADL